MCNDERAPPARQFIPPGVALMPDDFPARLTALRDMLGLNWEEMSVCLGVDPRQLLRWRTQGASPNGGAMLSLVRLAVRSPDGLATLLGEDVIVTFRPRR